MPVRSKLDREWPCWFHGPDGHSAVFNSPAEVPTGWTRHKPAQFTAASPLQVDEEAVKAKLIELGVEIDPTWGRAHLQKVLNDRSPSR
jgi:hypothetical protein